MHGANQRFMNGKTNWLANHLIVYNVDPAQGGRNPFGQGLGTVGATLPIQQFDLRKIGAIHMEHGGQAKEYELRQLTETNRNAPARKVGRRTHAIDAYFLPWGSGKTYCGRLGINADFFFTPTLNGCTFVYSDNGPNPSVAHSNFVDPATTLTDQVAITNSLNAAFGGAAPPNRLIKTDYKRAPIAGEDYCATVIGIRTGNSWRFYYQNYKTEPTGGGKLATNTGVDLCVEI
jgi:hypothetical protein